MSEFKLTTTSFENGGMIPKNILPMQKTTIHNYPGQELQQELKVSH